MLRTHILRTLLKKEAMRFRYNWGLLVMVFSLLVLSGLVSISARMNALPGQGGLAVTRYYVLHPRDSAWAAYLQQQRPPDGRMVGFRVDSAGGSAPSLPNLSMAIQILSTDVDAASQARPRVRYWYSETAPSGIVPYRDWFVRASNEYFRTEPRLIEETRRLPHDVDIADKVPLVITALVIFALYLLSFNLYITSTGEEREKRVLLAVLLSPARPAEVIAAKVIFYVSASLVVSVAIACMHEPRLLFSVSLWVAVVFGSIAYVSIGTVIISLVRRQTTISTVSMLYLVLVSTLMFLSQFLPIFVFLRLLLIEHFLHSSVHLIVSEQGRTIDVLIRLVALGVLAGVWAFGAVKLFARKGLDISRTR